MQDLRRFALELQHELAGEDIAGEAAVQRLKFRLLAGEQLETKM